MRARARGQNAARAARLARTATSRSNGQMGHAVSGSTLLPGTDDIASLMASKKPPETISPLAFVVKPLAIAPWTFVVKPTRTPHF